MFGQFMPFLQQFLQPFDLLSVTRQQMTPSNFSQPVVSQRHMRDLFSEVYFLIPNKCPVDYHKLPGTCRKLFVHLPKSSINWTRSFLACSLSLFPSNNTRHQRRSASSSQLRSRGWWLGPCAGCWGLRPPQQPRRQWLRRASESRRCSGFLPSPGRGGGGRNFLLASPCKSQRPVAAALLGGSVSGRTGAAAQFTCSGQGEMGHTAPLRHVPREDGREIPQQEPGSPCSASRCNRQNSPDTFRSQTTRLKLQTIHPATQGPDCCLMKRWIPLIQSRQFLCLSSTQHHKWENQVLKVCLAPPIPMNLKVKTKTFGGDSGINPTFKQHPVQIFPEVLSKSWTWLQRQQGFRCHKRT